MIPYFEVPVLHLGPLEIHGFGVLVATGILLGANRVRARHRQLGVSDVDSSNLATAIVLSGFVGAHLLDVFAYQTGALAERSWLPGTVTSGLLDWLRAFFRETKLGLIINPAAGLSSFGGFLGALVCLLVWTKKRHEAILPHADALLFGLTPGWFFGRLGCFSAHDHPGHVTDFFLAVNFPGGTRHDLGLDEAIFAGLLTALFLIMGRKQHRVGIYAALACLFYGPVRFALDFLRATDLSGSDPRYFGLTPAQYGAIGVTLTGVVIALRITLGASSPSAISRRAATSAVPDR